MKDKDDWQPKIIRPDILAGLLKKGVVKEVSGASTGGKA